PPPCRGRIRRETTPARNRRKCPDISYSTRPGRTVHRTNGAARGRSGLLGGSRPTGRQRHARLAEPARAALAGLAGEDGHWSPLGDAPAGRRHAPGQCLEGGLDLPALPSLIIAG